VKEAKKREAEQEVVFPCRLRIVPGCVFNMKDPIVIGVDVLDGILKSGTPLVIPHGEEMVDLGRVESVETNHKRVESAKKGSSVAIKIVSRTGGLTKTFGRHFTIDDEIYSHMTRCEEH
jgi:translation initiation factor 5B